jgi:hypothetical protein
MEKHCKGRCHLPRQVHLQQRATYQEIQELKPNPGCTIESGTNVQLHELTRVPSANVHT